MYSDKCALPSYTRQHVKALAIDSIYTYIDTRIVTSASSWACYCPSVYNGISSRRRACSAGNVSFSPRPVQPDRKCTTRWWQRSEPRTGRISPTLCVHVCTCVLQAANQSFLFFISWRSFLFLLLISLFTSLFSIPAFIITTPIHRFPFDSHLYQSFISVIYSYCTSIIW